MTTVMRASLRWVAVGAAGVNLGIHLYLSADHLQEMFYMGVLFIIASGWLGLVMIGLASDHRRAQNLAWRAGSLVCAGEFVGFVLSRTTGLPGGYLEGWYGSSEDLLGLASLFVELVFIACALGAAQAMSISGRRARPRGPVHVRSVPGSPVS